MLQIKSALISVFDKNGLEPIAKKLNSLGVKIYSTGGTENFLKKLNIPVIKVEDITNYPSILGGRVKTLHPKVFGGILNRSENENDLSDIKKYDIPNIDLVIVDLYPFEKTVASGKNEEEVIEKIDIGGISLIRAAAKNFKDVVCVSSKDDYEYFLSELIKNSGKIHESFRKEFAAKAFNVSSHYDTAIFKYFNS
jgi:phosphoribosylaminoimidazolecarboxamide formyltransferase / IMP cyclohydrolase